MTNCVLCGILFEPLDEDQKICDCCQDDMADTGKEDLDND